MASTLVFLPAAAKSLQSCPTLCDPIEGSPPGYPVPGILQARTLEWVAISISNAWKWKVKVKLLSHVRPSATPWTAAFQAPPHPWDFPGKSTGVGHGWYQNPQVQSRVQYLWSPQQGGCQLFGEGNGKPLQYSCLENLMNSIHIIFHNKMLKMLW